MVTGHNAVGIVTEPGVQGGREVTVTSVVTCASVQGLPHTVVPMLLHARGDICNTTPQGPGPGPGPGAVHQKVSVEETLGSGRNVKWEESILCSTLTLTLVHYEYKYKVFIGITNIMCGLYA